jgi:hypothetical protein
MPTPHSMEAGPLSATSAGGVFGSLSAHGIGGPPPPPAMPPSAYSVSAPAMPPSLGLAGAPVPATMPTASGLTGAAGLAGVPPPPPPPPSMMSQLGVLPHEGVPPPPAMGVGGVGGAMGGAMGGHVSLGGALPNDGHAGGHHDGGHHDGGHHGGGASVLAVASAAAEAAAAEAVAAASVAAVHMEPLIGGPVSDHGLPGLHPPLHDEPELDSALSKSVRTV